MLIRHAPTPETGRILTGRKPGVGLSVEGEEMAQRLAHSLAGVRLDALYASPVDRAWQTAEIVGAPHRLEPVVHGSFIENDYGKWVGRRMTDLYKLKAWRLVMSSLSRVRFPEGESMAEIQARAVEGCEDLASMHRRQTVAVVSHADVIRAAIGHYLGTPLDLMERMEVGPASVSVIKLPPDKPARVIAVNRQSGEPLWT